jgi:hypothetical protein
MYLHLVFLMPKANREVTCKKSKNKNQSNRRNLELQQNTI